MLVDSALRAKVADFGLACCDLDGGRRSQSAGAALWLAPELLRGGRPTPASDVYAYSILVAEVSPGAVSLHARRSLRVKARPLPPAWQPADCLPVCKRLAL